MDNLPPRFHYYVLGFVAAVAALNIFGASIPFLYAEGVDQTVPDTALTAQQAQDAVPTLPPEQTQPPAPATGTDLKTTTGTVPHPLTLQERKQRELQLLGDRLKAGSSTTVSDTTNSSTSTKTNTSISRQQVLANRLRLANRVINHMELLVKQLDSGDTALIDPSPFQTKVTTIRQEYNVAADALKLNTDDGAKAVVSYLKVLEDNRLQHVDHVITGLAGLESLTKVIKNADVKDQITQILQPIVDDINSGKFREASVLLDKAYAQLKTVAQTTLKIQRGRPGKIETVNKKLELLRKQMGVKGAFKPLHKPEKNGEQSTTTGDATPQPTSDTTPSDSSTTPTTTTTLPAEN